MPVADGYTVLPCCWITVNHRDGLVKKYGFGYDSVEPMDDIYNSEAFWRFREDLMEGRTQDICGKDHRACHSARGYPWVPPTDWRSAPEPGRNQ